MCCRRPLHQSHHRLGSEPSGRRVPMAYPKRRVEAVWTAIRLPRRESHSHTVAMLDSLTMFRAVQTRYRRAREAVAAAIANPIEGRIIRESRFQGILAESQLPRSRSRRYEKSWSKRRIGKAMRECGGTNISRVRTYRMLFECFVWFLFFPSGSQTFLESFIGGC